MSASRGVPSSLFQPGMAARYARTGASPSALAICGLPPERSFTGFALRARGSALAPAFGGDLDLDFSGLGRALDDLRGLPVRNVPPTFSFAVLSVIIRFFYP